MYTELWLRFVWAAIWPRRKPEVSQSVSMKNRSLGCSVKSLQNGLDNPVRRHKLLMGEHDGPDRLRVVFGECHEAEPRMIVVAQ
jgi:hypothetical protein